MKAAESLFEFMPYGAPELLQSRRERLASALLLSSLLVAALALAVVGLAERLATAPPVVPRVVSIPGVDIVPPPVWTPPQPRSATPPVRAPSVAGTPIPVPEPDVPLAQDRGAEETTGPVASGSASGSAEEADALSGQEVLPDRGVYVRVDELPEPVKQVKPGYPEIAREAGVEGLVIVMVLVGKTGRVLDARLDDKRQVPMLNDVALAAARQWVFTPALTGGNPVPVWTAIPFHFRLH